MPGTLAVARAGVQIPPVAEYLSNTLMVKKQLRRLRFVGNVYVLDFWLKLIAALFLIF